MTTEEIARKYGVPMPETCEKLNWDSDTIFYWCSLKHPFGVNLYLCQKKKKRFFIIDDENPRYLETTPLEELITLPAPQFHELISKHNEDYVFQNMFETLVKGLIANKPSIDIIKNGYNF